MKTEIFENFEILRKFRFFFGILEILKFKKKKSVFVNRR
jgi:hypothetical protein